MKHTVPLPIFNELYRPAGSWRGTLLAVAILLSGMSHVLAQSTTPPLGEAAAFGLLSGGNIEAVNSLRVFGKVGAAQAISSTITATDGLLVNATDVVPQALGDAQQTRDWCNSQSSQPLAGLAGQSLVAGVYTIAGDITLAQGQLLTLTGDTSSIYVFNIGGTVNLQRGNHLNLGQVRPNHVFWHIKGNLTVEAYTAWAGVVLTDGAISFAGDIYGDVALFASGAIQLASRDVASGALTVAAPLLRRNIPPAFTCINRAVQCLDPERSLVNNWGFEFGECNGNSATYADFDGYPTGKASRVYCWFGYGSPDWFTDISNQSCYSLGGNVPINQYNRHKTLANTAPTPNRTLLHPGYAGIYAKGPTSDRPNTVEEREYIMQQLNAPLDSSRPYYVEYYASLAPASYYTLGHLQVAFGTEGSVLPHRNSSGPSGIPAKINVVASTGNLPTGVGAGWSQVSGAFYPGNNYSLLMIGNFQPNDVGGIGPGYRQVATSTTGANSAPIYDAALNNLEGAYYYIDDVLLLPFTNAGSPTVQLSCGANSTNIGSCPLPLSSGATYQWSPATGLSSTTVSFPVATLPPGVTSMTYTLTVTAQGLSYTTQTTVISNDAPTCCSHNYGQLAVRGATMYQAPAGRADYELGDPNFNAHVNTSLVPVIIDGGGKTIVFNGIYHVLSPVVLENGTFEVTPGTIFYADGGQHWTGSAANTCYPHVADDRLRLTVGHDATVRASGATFTSTCNELWGGLVLEDTGALEMSADPKTAQHSIISQAETGVMLGTPCNNGDANCALTGTDFVNDQYGVVSLGFLSQRDGRRNYVTDCLFSSDPATILPPNAGSPVIQYTRAGLVLHGDWHNGIAYSKNNFKSVYVGVEVATNGASTAVVNNIFKDNYGAAIQVAGNSLYTPTNGPPAGTIRLTDNTIVVPAAPTPGGQVPAGATVRGIQVLALPMGGKALIIEGNTIANTAGGRDQAKPMIGLDAQLSFDQFLVQRQNRFIDFDEGIRLMDAAGATTREEYITDNYFEQNGTAVSLSGQQYATFAPAISCNTMQDGDRGIEIELNAKVGYLAGPLNTSTGNNEPVANQYNNIQFDVWNDSQNPVPYFGWDNPSSGIPEIPTSGGLSPVPSTLVPGTRCDQRQYSYGTGQNGLNRPGAGSATASTVAAWENMISQPNGQEIQLRTVTLQLISYREQNNQLAQLESFATQLPYINASSYDCISLYLLERYRHLGQDADAQRVRTQLLAIRGQDNEIRQRLAYYDVAGHLLTLAPLQLPSAADSTALVVVAGSTAGFAPVACATLRYFYPALSCQAGMNRSVVRAAPYKDEAVAPKRLEKLRAWPNPTRDLVQIQLSNPASHPVRVELVNLETGQVVLTQAVTSAAAVEVSTAGVPAGVYAGRLYSADQMLGTCKVVVLH